MSRPGFPKQDTYAYYVANNYHAASSNTDYPGVDSHYRRFYREDAAGANTPGWPHNIQTNYYSRSRHEWIQEPLTVSGTRTDNADTFSGEWSTVYGLGYDPWLDNDLAQGEGPAVTDMMIRKLISNMQSHRVNLGEVAHTRSQTASLVASSATRIAQSFLALRRGNFTGAARHLLGTNSRLPIKRAVGGIPDQWLQLQYGWKPLLQDVYNSCETVRDAWNQSGNEVFTVRASAKMTSDKYQREFKTTQANGPWMRLETTKREVRGNASVTYGIDSPSAISLSQFGLTNPLSLGWELLPYSFVVDWFYPVGPFLESLDYSRGLVFRHGYTNLMYRQELRRSMTVTTGSDGPYRTKWSGGGGSGTAMYFVRSAMNSFPDPPPPSFKDPFSLTHVANALSLLATAFRGKALVK